MRIGKILIILLLSINSFATAQFIPGKDYKLLTPDELEQKLTSKEKFYIFDNNLELYYSKGHIPGAKLLFYNDVSLKTMPNDKNANIIFYCKNTMCFAAPMAAEKALKLGFKNVSVMHVGIEGWLKAGKRFEK